jgi:hypothetical protein
MLCVVFTKWEWSRGGFEQMQWGKQWEILSHLKMTK